MIIALVDSENIKDVPMGHVDTHTEQIIFDEVSIELLVTLLKNEAIVNAIKISNHFKR